MLAMKAKFDRWCDFLKFFSVGLESRFVSAFDLTLLHFEKKNPGSSQGFLTVKIRPKVWSNYREITVGDTGSVILEENVCLLGGKEGSWKFCRCFVIRVKPDVCLAVCLRARARACVFMCVVVSGKFMCLYVCVCVFIYVCAFMCVFVLFSEARRLTLPC